MDDEQATPSPIDFVFSFIFSENPVDGRYGMYVLRRRVRIRLLLRAHFNSCDACWSGVFRNHEQQQRRTTHGTQERWAS